MSAIIPDPEDIGKLFVGGLSSSTTRESLQSYFSQFGEVIDSVVMKNNETGRSRGFGFVTFKEPSCMFKALQIKNHELDGKKIDPKECTPRSMQKVRKQAGKCKVFLGGLPPDITEEAIRKGMSKFGKVDQVIIMIDQESKKCRGFGFLSFELEESIDQACAERYVNINGKQIECKKAEPRLNPKRSASAYSKNQNGSMGQASYAQVAHVQQNDWSMQPSQPLYNMPGNAYASYANYTHPGIVPMNTTAPCYPNLQPMQYASPYTPNYGNYSCPPIQASAYSQSAFPVSPSLPNISGSLATFTAESGKSTGSNDYTQSASMYGPTKATYAGNATDVTYNSQGVVPSANYQRYHPYKL